MKMRLLFATSIACLTVTRAAANWEVTFLEEVGTSTADGVSGQVAVGHLGVAGNSIPRLWHSTTGLWEDLLPPGYDEGWCFDTDGIQQVGYVANVGRTASLWTGNAASWVSLGPGTAYDVEDGVQVGASSSGACLWHGTAGSRVDLAPPGLQNSVAYSLSGGVQVGMTYQNFNRRAAIWRGTAASFAELHPNWATESEALAANGGQQVGWASTGFSIVDLYASLWTGKASTWRSLNPRFARAAECWGTHEGRQVGSAYPQGGGQVACIWRGDADSAENLGESLPLGMQNNCRAEDIDVDDNGTVRVVGQASFRAVMWTRHYDISPVTSASVFPGVQIGGNLKSLLSSDDDKYAVRLGVTLSSSQAPLQIVCEGNVPHLNPTSLEFVVDSRTSAPNIEFRIQFFNFQSGQYETPYERESSTEDTYAIAYSVGDPQRFVEPGTRKVRARLTCRAFGPVLSFPWRCEIDRAIWMTPAD